MNKHLHIPKGISCLAIIFLLFGYMGYVMGLTNMLNTIMKTAHELLLNTVFYLMGMCVITGALGKIFTEFGVVDLLQKGLKPVMRPVFNMPGVASLGAVLTFLSDNPAIIALSKDKGFARYFKKYQHVSLVNFGTAFGMGLLVIVFMMGQGYYLEPIVGFFGAMCGCVIATRLMQHYTCKDYPNFRHENAISDEELEKIEAEEQLQKADIANEHKDSTFVHVLNTLLDGGKDGVHIGLAIIPGVLIISTLVMMLTFGGSDGVEQYTGEAFQGTALLPWLADKINFVFEWLFGFTAPELISFPITALGAVGAALGLIPEFAAKGIIDGNAIAVFTAMGMCWSGYLSTDAATLDSLGYRSLVPRAFFSTFVGGICAGVITHWLYVGIMAIVSLFAPKQIWTVDAEAYVIQDKQHSITAQIQAFDDGSYTIKDWYGEKGFDLSFTVNHSDSSLVINNAERRDNQYYIAPLSKSKEVGKPSYAAIYVSNAYSKFEGNAEKGRLYFFAYIYDCNKHQVRRGYYELLWGGAEKQTIEAEESIMREWREDLIKAVHEADSIRQQQLVDSILDKMHGPYAQ